MVRIRQFCGQYIYEIDGDRIRRFCGPYMYEIEGPISQRQLMALIAILFA